MATDIGIRLLKFAILQCLASGGAQHKLNLIGKGYSISPLESALDIRFDSGQRHLASMAFDELEAAELIRPTYTDLVSPQEWMEITDAGREALRRRELDALDTALSAIAPQLVELRAGAWSTIASGRPDALRQAAHSGRELIDQALKEGATTKLSRLSPGFDRRGIVARVLLGAIAFDISWKPEVRRPTRILRLQIGPVTWSWRPIID
jgi:hypothetical protein